MAGAQMVIQALVDQGVDTIFGYPGGAILPVYDALFHQEQVHHILVRHEQAAAHAAEGYARSSGRVGVALVTSGPGVTNTVTGLTDALLDSIPIVCICGQVATHLLGTDAFQEADTTGITRACTKHNYLVRNVDQLSEVLHQAFHVARSGRPGPVLIDLPKDVQVARGKYLRPEEVSHYKHYPYSVPANDPKIDQALEWMAQAQRPIFYTGGGVINAGPQACELLRNLVHATGFPITNTLMGLGAYPASDRQFLGMLGMHGTYEANLTMYHCDLMIAVGARFDDRVTGKLSEFSPHSKKIHIDVDPSQINKIVHVDLGITADASCALEALLESWKHQGRRPSDLRPWWSRIEQWRSRQCLAFKQVSDTIKPQYAIQRLYEKTRHQDPIITTEVGQHQMWAAQYFGFERPNRWLTSGGLGTMGYGFPAAIGAQLANPEALVIDIAGDGSILMNLQELSTAVQYRLPVKIFIINNRWLGMVRQWQELVHGGRYSQSYSEALPDFVKLAEAYGALGLRATKALELDRVIDQMVAYDGPVVADIWVDPNQNCYPMIHSGAPHYQMLLEDESNEPVQTTEVGRAML